MIRVWNITNLTDVGPTYINISGKRCAPGKHVDLESITEKERKLVGSYLYLGDHLPSLDDSTDNPLTIDQCKDHLRKMTHQQLVELSGKISPPLTSDPKTKSLFWLSSKIASAVFSKHYSVDPSYFLWTNKWELVSSGFKEK